MSPRIPFTVRDKNVKINAISGMNFDDININTVIKKVDDNNAGNSNIQSYFTANGSVTALINGDPNSILSPIGGQIITDLNGVEKQIELTVGADSSKRSIIIQENQPIVIEDDLTVVNLDVTGLIKLDGTTGNAGDILTSNGASDPTWNSALSPIIVGAYLSLSSVAGTAAVPLTVIFDTVEFDTLSSYNSATGVFTAPRDSYYMFSCFARVTDFSAPNGNRIQSIIQKKPIGGAFSNYSVTDTVDVETNFKAGTGSSNMLIKLLTNEEIKYQVAMDGGSGWLLRGNAFEVRCTYLSIHSVN